MGKASRTRRPRTTVGPVLDRRTAVAGHCTYPSTVTLREDEPQGWTTFGEPLWVVEQEQQDVSCTHCSGTGVGHPSGQVGGGKVGPVDCYHCRRTGMTRKTRVGWSYTAPPPGTTYDENGVRT
jgi:hypothetical protein